MAAWAAIRHAVTPCAQRTMHDALETSAVQRDKRVGPDGLLIEQMAHATQVPGAFLAHRGREQHRTPYRQSRPNQRIPYGDQCGEPAGVVGDSRSLKPRSLSRYGNVELGTKDGVQMRAENHTIG